MKSKLFVLLIMAVFCSDKYENAQNGQNSGETESEIFVKIEESQYDKKKVTSDYIGVGYRNSKWYVKRWNKHEQKHVFYRSYDDEETAAHASDTLARKLTNKGEKGLKLNFPEDHTEVHPEKKTTTSEYIGVGYSHSKWYVERWSKNEKKNFFYGCYDNEEKAAHASDTLASKLMENGEQGHELNFPDDHTEVHRKTTSSEYFGVTYHKKRSKWFAQRYSKSEKKMVSKGYYDNEETAAHASDTLARKLMENGGQGHKLNFPDDHTEKFQKKKRKRKEDN